MFPRRSYWGHHRTERRGHETGRGPRTAPKQLEPLHLPVYKMLLMVSCSKSCPKGASDTACPGTRDRSHRHRLGFAKTTVFFSETERRPQSPPCALCWDLVKSRASSPPSPLQSGGGTRPPGESCVWSVVTGISAVGLSNSSSQDRGRGRWPPPSGCLSPGECRPGV